MHVLASPKEEMLQNTEVLLVLDGPPGKAVADHRTKGPWSWQIPRKGPVAVLLARAKFHVFLIRWIMSSQAVCYCDID
jgi:hypothetical protein